MNDEYTGRIVAICYEGKSVVIQLPDARLIDVEASSYLVRHVLKRGDSVSTKNGIITHLHRIIYR